MSNFSLDRPGALQQRGGDSDGLPGTAASVAGTVRARCLVSTGTRETTPGSSNCSSMMYLEIHLFQRHVTLYSLVCNVSCGYICSRDLTLYSLVCNVSCGYICSRDLTLHSFYVMYLEIHLS